MTGTDGGEGSGSEDGRASEAAPPLDENGFMTFKIGGVTLVADETLRQLIGDIDKVDVTVRLKPSDPPPSPDPGPCDDG